MAGWLMEKPISPGSTVCLGQRLQILKLRTHNCLCRPASRLSQPLRVEVVLPIDAIAYDDEDGL